MANQTIYPFGPGGQMPTTIPIADDLVTDRADMALSARQGKKIASVLPMTGVSRILETDYPKTGLMDAEDV